MSTIAVRFGRRVRTERQRRGLSVSALAAKAGVAHRIVYGLESGTRGCHLDSAVRIADALGISLDGLTGPCGRCGDEPEPWRTCNACGVSGPEPAP